jgi:hypothetical protein
LNLTTGDVSLLYNGSEISEMFWIGPTDTSVIYVNGTNDEEDGGISMYAGDVTAIDEAYVLCNLLCEALLTIPKVSAWLFTGSLLWPEGRRSSQWRYPLLDVLLGISKWNSIQRST